MTQKDTTTRRLDVLKKFFGKIPGKGHQKFIAMIVFIAFGIALAINIAELIQTLQ